jgi:type II secretory pathway component PulF
MELPLALLGIMLGLAAAWLIIRLITAAVGTVAWSLSGESGALSVRGFHSHGSRMRKTADLRCIVEHMRVATRLNLPLPGALRLAGDGEPGQIGRQLGLIADHVGAGEPLSEALMQAVSGCPPLLVEMIRRGERCGQTAEALDTASRVLGERLTETPHRSAHAFLYFLAVGGVTITILSGLMIVIVPKFREIFLDFDTPLPPVTRSLIDYCQPATVGLLAALALVIIPCLLAMGSVLGSKMARPGITSPFAWLVGRMRRLFPLTRRIDFGFGMAGAVRAIALAVRSGLPLDRAIESADTVGPGNPLAPRLRAFMQKVREGTMPHLAARETGLGSVFVTGLRSIERGEAPEPVLDYAAEHYQAIAYRWWNVLASMSTPVVTLILAAGVGFVAYAMFLPLVTLINSVSESFG